MPTMRRPGHCFCLFTILALACDTSGSAAPKRSAVPPPPPLTSEAAPTEPGTYNLRGTPMTGRTRRVEQVTERRSLERGMEVEPLTMRVKGTPLI